MIIDDDKKSLHELTTFFLLHGFEVYASHHALVALRVFQLFPADLVITNLFMPELDGVELIQSMKAIQTNTHFIVTSVREKSANLDFMQISRDVGAAYALKKPVNLPHVFAKVVQLLGSATRGTAS